METRILIAYGLIAAMVVFMAAAFFLARYNAHDRKIERRRKRDYERYRRLHGDDGISDLSRSRTISTSEDG